jgi:hypothetical protein
MDNLSENKQKKLKDIVFEFLGKINIRKVINYIIGLTIVLIVILMFHINNKEETNLTYSLVNNINEQITNEFNNLLMPINRNLSMIYNWGKSGLLDKINNHSLNSSFITILEQNPHISSIMIVDKHDVDYLIIRDNLTWVTRTKINKRRKKNLWQRLESTDKVIEEWQSDFQYYPDMQFWFKQVLDKYLEKKIYWRRPNALYSNNESVSTAVIKWRMPGSKRSKLVAINVLLNEVTQLVKDKYIDTNAKVFVISENGNLVAYSSDDKYNYNYFRNVTIIKNISKNRIFRDSIKKWKQNRDTNPFIFQSEEKSWLAKFKKLNKQTGSLLIGVIVAKKDLLSAIKDEQNLYTYLIACIFIIVFLTMTSLILRAKNDFTKDGNKYSEKDILDIINKGESSKLEFKSSLRWHYYKSVASKKIEEIILKSIAAFNNADGGRLIIGINDVGEIIGLDNDYQTLQGNDRDHFELHFRNLVNSAYGIDFATNNLAVNFPVVSGKDLCVVDIKKGKKPLYTKITDKKGFKVEKLYVRSGNSSQEIIKPSDIANFLKNRFR